MNAEKILLIQMAKLGDFIQSTPLLAKVRQKYPRAEICLAAEEPSVIESAGLSPLVDRVIEVAGAQKLPSDDYEAVFVLNSHRRAAALAAGLSSREYYGPLLSESELYFTEAQKFLLAVMETDRRLGRFNLVDVWASLIPDVKPQPLLWPVKRLKAAESSAPYKIGLQLGGRNHLRRWPVESFLSFTKFLAECGSRNDFSLSLYGSAPEKALGVKFERGLASDTEISLENLIGRTDLQSLAGHLAGLDLLVTADTGVMHLAAAVGTPVLSLFFGPAFGPETGPYGHGHLIYQTLAPCAPCLENGHCRRRQCLEMPDPEIAARLTLARLEGAGEISDSALPPGHRVWRTGQDKFGQQLRPFDRRLLDSEEAAALLLTEAGRGIINPAYEPSAAVLRQVIDVYARPEEPVKVDAGLFKKLLTKKVLNNNDPGVNFFEAALQLAESVGFKIA